MQLGVDRTVVWGAVGFALAFAPGYLVVRAFGLQRYVPAFAGSFALSIIINGTVVPLLVLLGLYTMPVIRWVGTPVVITALFFLARDSDISLRVASDSLIKLLKRLAPMFNSPINAGTVGTLMLAGLIVCAAFAAANSLQTIQHLVPYASAFAVNDAVMSWNRWAVDWANNRFPSLIWHYPQALPILWSVPYVAMGTTSLELFSSTYKLVFWLCTFESVVFVAWRRSDWLLLLAIPLIGHIYPRVMSHFAFHDMADVPVAFFALLSATAVITAERSAAWPVIVLALLFAGGAATVKQAGLFMLLATPILLLWTDRQQGGSPSIMLRRMLLPWLASVALVVPIYIYAELTIARGTNGSEIASLTTGFSSRFITGIANVARSLAMDSDFMTANSMLLVAALALIAARRNSLNFLLLICALPFTVIWGLFFSYDGRNFAVALPFYALWMAGGLSALIRLCLRSENLIRASLWLKHVLFGLRSIIENSIRSRLALKHATAQSISRPERDVLWPRLDSVLRLAIIASLIAGTFAIATRWDVGRLVERQTRRQFDIVTSWRPDLKDVVVDVTTKVNALKGAPTILITDWDFLCLLTEVRENSKCMMTSQFAAPADTLRSPAVKKDSPVIAVAWRENDSWIADLTSRGFVPFGVADRGLLVFIKQ